MAELKFSVTYLCISEADERMYGETHLLRNAGLRVFLWIHPCNQACPARQSFGEKSWYVPAALALIILSNCIFKVSYYL